MQWLLHYTGFRFATNTIWSQFPFGYRFLTFPSPPASLHSSWSQTFCRFSNRLIKLLLSVTAFEERFLCSPCLAHEPYESRHSSSYLHVCLWYLQQYLEYQEICQMDKWKNGYYLLNLKIFESSKPPAYKINYLVHTGA